MTICDKCGKGAATWEAEVALVGFPEPNPAGDTPFSEMLLLCDSCAKPIIELLERK